MHTSQPPVRTHRAFDDQETFQQMMADRLRQSPWVLLSFVAHAVVLLLVWALLPPAQQKARAAQIVMQDTTQQQVEQPKPLEEPEVQKEEVDPEVTPIEDVAVQDLSLIHI